MVAIYRIYVQGWNKENAIKELEHFGMHTIWKNIPEYIRKFDIDKIKSIERNTTEPEIEIIE